MKLIKVSSYIQRKEVVVKALLCSGLLMSTAVTADIVHLDDVIVEGGLCASGGNACADGENFTVPNGVSNIFPEIIAKDPFPAIALTDTSAGDADWLILTDGINEALSIEWDEGASAGRPFTIENGTGNNLLYLDSSERVGINTSAPIEELDVRSTLPAIRIDDTSVGAGVVDLQLATNRFSIEGNSGQDIFNIDSRLPANLFNLQRNTAGNPEVLVRGTPPGALVYLENNSASSASRDVIRIKNRGGPNLKLEDTSVPFPGGEWTFRTGVAGTRFVIGKTGSGVVEMQVFSGGNMQIAGNLTANGVLYNSSRKNKDKIDVVDANEILEKISTLPVSEWSYKKDDGSVRHIGPMAEDFHAAFDLKGSDKSTISSIDVAGVSLAAIKGLNQLISDKDNVIQDQGKKLAEQEKSISNLEDKLTELTAMVEKLQNNSQIAVVY